MYAKVIQDAYKYTGCLKSSATNVADALYIDK